VIPECDYGPFLLELKDRRHQVPARPAASKSTTKDTAGKTGMEQESGGKAADGGMATQTVRVGGLEVSILTLDDLDLADGLADLLGANDAPEGGLGDADVDGGAGGDGEDAMGDVSAAFEVSRAFP
jgi:hypothetical protein